MINICLIIFHVYFIVKNTDFYMLCCSWNCFTKKVKIMSKENCNANNLANSKVKWKNVTKYVANDIGIVITQCYQVNCLLGYIEYPLFCQTTHLFKHSFQELINLSSVFYYVLGSSSRWMYSHITDACMHLCCIHNRQAPITCVSVLWCFDGKMGDMNIMLSYMRTLVPKSGMSGMDK